nr:putative ribonuclease H-like domain-containing protein [Tanacetum cinerariifolium]
MYENFNAPITESINSIFNMLHKIVSQLAILGENISQEDLNMKFLRSLPFAWNTHVVVWRNRVDLDIMSIDDLYNNFKIVEQEVKIIVVSISSSGSPNMAFISSPGSTNKVDTASIKVSVVSTPVSIVSSHDNTSNLSDVTVYTFLANQSNRSQLLHEDLEQIHEDDMKEIDLKWQLALLSMRARRYFQRTGKKITINGSDIAGYNKTKVECFNCHKMGYFARECRSLRNQESRPKNQDNSRKTVIVEDTSSKAMVAIDGACFDWSYMADDDVPTNMALIAFLDSKKEKESNQIKINNFKNESKSLDKLIGSQITDNSKIGLGFTSYNVVAPLLTGLFAPPSIDLSNSGLEEFQHPKFKGYGPKDSKSVCIDTSNEIKKAPDAPIIKDWVSVSDEDESEDMVLKFDNVQHKPEQANQPRKANSVNTAKGNKVTSAIGNQGINAVKSLACWVWRPKIKVQDHVSKNSGSYICKRFNYVKPEGRLKSKIYPTSLTLRSMMEGMIPLGGAKGGKITSKGTIRTGGGPEWLFDIDALSKSMNYASVYAGTNSNDFADNSLFDSSSQALYSHNKDKHGPSQASKSDNHERSNAESSTKTINTATPTYADYPNDPLIPNLEDARIFNDAYDDRDEGAEADYNNLETDIQEELLQFKLLNVWTLVDLPPGKRAIETKWVYSNKRDQRGIVVKNKARQIAQGHRQEEGIDYDEVFAPVARIEAFMLFLAFASFMDFIVYQMDVKSAFLYGTIEEEVYVNQPPGFVDPEFPDRLHKVEKALYGLHQAPRAWYETSSTYILDNGFKRGTIDKTLFIKKIKDDILLVQVYVDDIVFGSTKRLDIMFATKIYVDNESAICMVKNPVYHSKTKHIEIRHHFIRDSNETRLIEKVKIHTDYNVLDLLTKAFDVTRFQFLIASIGLLNP